MDSFNVIPGHRKAILYAVARDSLTLDFMNAFEENLVSLSATRRWVISPPQLVDYTEVSTATNAENHVYGCALAMYSALPPWGEHLPKAVDQLHFEEASLLLAALYGLSKQFECEFALQLDDVHVGVITNGVPDEGIQVGLIDEWKSALGI